MEDPIPASTEFLQNEDSYNIVARPTDWTWGAPAANPTTAPLSSPPISPASRNPYLLRVVNPGSFEIAPHTSNLCTSPAFRPPATSSIWT